MAWPTIRSFREAFGEQTMLPPEPSATLPGEPITFFNGSVVDGATKAIKDAIISNGGIQDMAVVQPQNGIERFIPLIIIGLILYFVFK